MHQHETRSSGKGNLFKHRIYTKRFGTRSLKNQITTVWNQIHYEHRSLPFNSFKRQKREEFLYGPTPYRNYSEEEEKDLIDYIGEALIRNHEKQQAKKKELQRKKRKKIRQKGKELEQLHKHVDQTIYTLESHVVRLSSRSPPRSAFRGCMRLSFFSEK